MGPKIQPTSEEKNLRYANKGASHALFGNDGNNYFVSTNQTDYSDKFKEFSDAKNNSPSAKFPTTGDNYLYLGFNDVKCLLNRKHKVVGEPKAIKNYSTQTTHRTDFKVAGFEVKELEDVSKPKKEFKELAVSPIRPPTAEEVSNRRTISNILPPFEQYKKSGKQKWMDHPEPSSIAVKRAMLLGSTIPKEEMHLSMHHRSIKNPITNHFDKGGDCSEIGLKPGDLHDRETVKKIWTGHAGHIADSSQLIHYDAYKRSLKYTEERVDHMKFLRGEAQREMNAHGVKGVDGLEDRFLLTTSGSAFLN